MDKAANKGHYVYIVECRDGTLYTGYTVDIAKRLAEHNSGNAAKYTRGRTPVVLRYLEEGASRSWGLKREIAIKQLTRKQKMALIEGSDSVAAAKVLHNN